MTEGMPTNTVADQDLAASEAGPARTARDFVRTPFAIRCNVVKVWRPLPPDLWTGLSQPQDMQASKRFERRCITGTLGIIAVLLMVASVGIVVDSDTGATLYPLLGWAASGADLGSGWVVVPLHAWSLIAWVAGPSLGGWFAVRGLWIPWLARRRDTAPATVALARYLSAVYLYVYIMIVVGALLMFPLAWLSPARTEMLRWCLWCFLFGESFFVPAVMWLRLVICDADGAVFGTRRMLWMAAYLIACVVIPLWGMIQELD